MNEVEIEAAVQWFRQGIKEQLDKDVETYHFPYATPWWIEGAYEAGVLLAEQMQCEKTGHDDEVRSWSSADGAKKLYRHGEDRECRLCGRIKTVIIASFDNQDEFDAYSLDQWKKKREAEKK